MISFDFEYYRPSTIEEAVAAYLMLDSQGKKTFYYGGGTEIITLARINQLYTEAVIDIKEIPECRMLEFVDNELVIGAGVTLSKIRESNMFPLLSQVIRRASDHTSRNKITLGGSICSSIPYREASLPFLLSDSQVVTAGPQGLRYIKLMDIYNKCIQLGKGEFIIQLKTDKSYLPLPYISIKKTRQDKVDYPLLSIAALMKDNLIRAAFSGLCAFPFRSTVIEAELNKSKLSIPDRIDSILSKLPDIIITDIRGSAEYREFVFRNAMYDLINQIGGMQ